MSNYIFDLITQGENQFLDFKFCISDSRKIARSLVAFANTNGGTLLIGVKDNGTITGISEDEEYYMVEAAADLYCNPPVKFDSRNWVINGKRILEITIPESKKKPHTAKTDDGKWRAFTRVNDQNMLANIVEVKVWTKEHQKRGLRVKYSEKERILLAYLKHNKVITLSKFIKIASISKKNAEEILANLIVWKVIKILRDEGTLHYTLLENTS